MNETHVNRPQMDEAQAEETRADETQAGGNVDVELLRRARLNAMLRELVRQEGRMEAAELLGVNYKTLVRAEESEQVTGRVKDALERLLGTVDDPEDAARQRERFEALEERVAGLEGGMKELRDGLDGLRAGAPGGEAQGGEQAQTQARDGEHGEGAGRAETRAAQGTGDDEGAGWSATKAAPPVAGLRSSRRAKLRRLDPEIVTVEPAEDDVEVYGAAWPLVEEWRALRAGHPNQGRSLSWLVAEERQLTLELAMLEEHGLTLPPETQPLRGFGRKGQTSWRWTALHDTRRALARRRLWRWVRRVCTLGLWWK